LSHKFQPAFFAKRRAGGWETEPHRIENAGVSSTTTQRAKSLVAVRKNWDKAAQPLMKTQPDQPDPKFAQSESSEASPPSGSARPGII